MTPFEWFKVFIYVLLWVFTWTLLDSIATEYNITNKDLIKICFIGLLVIVSLIQIYKINIS